MYQQITIIGNLGRDPEMRYTASGIPVTSFSVAASRTWTDQSGERQDKTTWFRVTAWRRQAEICAQYLTKGQKVLVVGEIEDPNTWTDQQGQVRASLEVTAQTVRFLSAKGEVDGGASSGPARSSGGTPPPASSDEGSGEDIPF